MIFVDTNLLVYVHSLATPSHRAALAVEHGAVLYINNRDFSRFPRLEVRYPLQES